MIKSRKIDQIISSVNRTSRWCIYFANRI